MRRATSIIPHLLGGQHLGHLGVVAEVKDEGEHHGANEVACCEGLTDVAHHVIVSWLPAAQETWDQVVQEEEEEAAEEEEEEEATEEEEEEEEEDEEEDEEEEEEEEERESKPGLTDGDGDQVVCEHLGDGDVAVLAGAEQHAEA